MDNSEQKNVALEQGIQTLRECFGDQAYELIRVPTRDGEAATFAWLLPRDYLDVRRRLNIGFPDNFPKSGLKLDISPTTWLLWPHSSHSTFCLYGAGQSPSFGDPAEIVRQTFWRFLNLFRIVMPEANPDERRKHFEREIKTYWSMQLPPAHHQLVLIDLPSADGPVFSLSYDLVKPGEPHRHWLASDKDALRRYLRKLYGRFFPLKAPAEAAFFARLKSYPPVKVPSIQAFFEWLQPHINADTTEALSSWWEKSHKYPIRWIVLELPDTTPPSTQVFVLRQLGMRNSGHKVYGGRAAKRISPVKVLPQGYVLQEAIAHILTDDVVYSRFMTPEVRCLRGKKVALVGVGSLGSNVASHLLRTGVGELILIDPDIFKDANLGRHILGADDLGRTKASSLTRRLQEDFPLANIRAFDTTIDGVFRHHKPVLDEVDLIINTTADWRAEQDVWRLRKIYPRWSCIQGWVEPHALIGHALYAPANLEESPEYMFDQQGRFEHRFSEWPDGGIQFEPACGEGFIVGGPITISSTAAIIADLAVQVLTEAATDPIWNTLVCRPETIFGHGGEYKGPPLPSGIQQMVLSRPWPSQSNKCTTN